MTHDELEILVTLCFLAGALFGFLAFWVIHRRVEINMSKDGLACSFCGNAAKDVRNLISGPNVFICEACIGAAAEIVRDTPPAAEDKVASIDEDDGEIVPPLEG